MVIDSRLLTVLGVGIVFGLLLCVRKSWGPVARRTIGTTLLFCLFAVVVMYTLVAVFIIASGQWLDFGGNEEYTELTYEQYKSRVGILHLDPVGAKDISYYRYKTIDSYDVWLKMHLPADAYDLLLDRMKHNMEDLDFVGGRGKAAGPVRKVTDNSLTIPANWPSLASHSSTQNQVVCTRWELQLVGSHSDRAKGWYWLYDRDIATLWIWEWNYQHWDLAWERH